MQLEAVLDRLARVKREGDRWRSSCPSPAHEHGNRSAPALTVWEGDDRIVLHCFAGCSQDDVLAAIGLTWRDIIYEQQSDEPEAVYPYTDEGGKLLYEVVRFPGKKFRQRKADGDWNLNGTRRVLYRLPEVLYGVETGKTIYVTEGEKCADALRKHGKVATCNSGGAGKWRDEYSECLRGANVVIVQDKDEPGRAHAQTVKQSLRDVAANVWVVEARQGKDAYDHLSKGFAVEDFQRAAGKTVELPIKSVKQFAASIPPYMDEKDYLGPFIHGGHRIHVAGPTGAGKTTFMLEAESAALRGSEFLDWHGRGNLRALHIDLEMPDELLHQAVIDARLGEVAGLDILHLPDGLEIDTNTSHRQMIEKACDGYDIVTIDPWYKLVQNELEYSATRAVIGLLDGLRAKHPRMCMLIGFHTHEPHNSDERLNISSIRGFKAWHNPADVVLTFQRLKDNHSRLVWCKNRSAKLRVSVDDEWTLHWTRGEGFQRVYELGDTHVPGVIGS